MQHSFNGPRRSRGGRTFNSNHGGQSARRSFKPKQKRGAAASIDPQRFVNKAKTAQENVPYVPTHTFADFNFAAPLQRNIQARNYVHPTPIQDGAIKPVLAGKDLIGLANTGT